MKIFPAIAATPYKPKSLILTERKIVCVVLDADDMDRLQDRAALTVNLEEHFTELPQVSTVLVYHNNTEEAIKAFKEAFNLIYLDGRKV